MCSLNEKLYSHSSSPLFSALLCTAASGVTVEVHSRERERETAFERASGACKGLKVSVMFARLRVWPTSAPPLFAVSTREVVPVVQTLKRPNADAGSVDLMTTDRTK